MGIPKLVVFDLDFTLWDCGGTWIDCTSPPFALTDGKILDRSGRWLRLYPDVPQILDELDARGISIGLASRTTEPIWAEEVLEMMKIRHRFQLEEIYPDSKVRHFGQLQESTGYSYEEMLFFDDEQRNIDEVGNLGVKSVFVTQGIERSVFQCGMDLF